MMSRRPVASPGRVEKYPPPLMRFFRSSSSGGSRNRSRSRGRSRSSPLFVRRSKSSSAAASAQEPSSPKVTCMGQVRVGRSKPQTRPGSHGNPTRRCKWIRDALLRRPFAGKLRTWSFNRNWTKWVSFSFPSFRRKSKRKENSTGSRVDPDSVRENGRESGEGEEEEEWGNYRNPRRIIVSPASTPPRNALFLTRSRSAPYRSSSLAFRFWESDNRRETEAPNIREEEEEEEEEEGACTSRNSGQDPEPDTRTAGKIEGPGESEGSIEGKEAKCEKSEEEEEEGEEEKGVSEVGFVRTPVLGRSKSGPARIGEKMVGERVAASE